MPNLEDNLNIIFIEKMLVTKLLTQTVDLIHATKTVPVIKKLTQAHDILTLNQEIIAKFGEKSKFCWDKAAVKDLNYISKELLVFHREEFDPIQLVFNYSNNVTNLINSLYENDRVMNG